MRFLFRIYSLLGYAIMQLKILKTFVILAAEAKNAPINWGVNYISYF
ncbi:hypothetical protein SAMN05660206_11525 [Sphingobacterium wenxiniae]|uniref:Uncharacterized protein n=1 Tax=Sphingobacterium wenxiniae TaxID=683125 RepID=A0A1I6VLH7_9SPHI|nr:hypothetical protein SAMN05660206_11525 [Sphingobacterium wenxiniae]